MTYEQRCPVCGKLTFYVGDAVPGMLCDCHTRQVTYIDWAGESKLLAERDEARRWARRMWIAKLRSDLDIVRLREENAALRRELEALKRRLPVWFDVGYNETDQQPDGFPPYFIS